MIRKTFTALFIALLAVLPITADQAKAKPEADGSETAETTSRISASDQHLQDARQPLTLAQCIAIALEANHRIGAAREEHERTRATVRQNYSLTRPRVTLQNVFTRLGEVPSIQPPDGGDGMSLGEKEINISKLVLTQPIYTWGRLPLGVEMVRKMQDASSHALKAREVEVVFDLLKNYIGLLKSRNILKISLGTRALLEAHLEIAEALFREGVTLKTDVLATRVQLLETTRMVIESEHALKAAEQRLRNILVLPEDHPIEVIDLILDQPPIMEFSETASGVSERPDINQMKSLVEMQEKNYQIERRGNTPTIGLMANWESGSQFNQEQRNWNANIVFEFPFFDGGMTRARSDEARARLNETRRVLDDMHQQKRLDLQLSIQKCRELEEMMAVVNEGLETAAERQRLVMALLQEGAVLNTDALEAQLALNKAMIQHSNLSLDIILAHAEVFRNIGRLTDFFSFITQDENPTNQTEIENQ